MVQSVYQHDIGCGVLNFEVQNWGDFCIKQTRFKGNLKKNVEVPKLVPFLQIKVVKKIEVTDWQCSAGKSKRNEAPI